MYIATHLYQALMTCFKAIRAKSRAYCLGIRNNFHKEGEDSHTHPSTACNSFNSLKMSCMNLHTLSPGSEACLTIRAAANAFQAVGSDRSRWCSSFTAHAKFLRAFTDSAVYPPAINSHVLDIYHAHGCVLALQR